MYEYVQCTCPVAVSFNDATMQPKVTHTMRLFTNCRWNCFDEIPSELSKAHIFLFLIFSQILRWRWFPKSIPLLFQFSSAAIRKPRCSINYLYQEIVGFYYYKIHLSKKLFLFAATNIIYHLINETRGKQKKTGNFVTDCRIQCLQ